MSYDIFLFLDFVNLYYYFVVFGDIQIIRIAILAHPPLILLQLSQFFWMFLGHTEHQSVHQNSVRCSNHLSRRPLDNPFQFLVREIRINPRIFRIGTADSAVMFLEKKRRTDAQHQNHLEIFAILVPQLGIPWMSRILNTGTYIHGGFVRLDEIWIVVRSETTR